MPTAKKPPKAKPSSVLSDVGHTMVDTVALLGSMVTEGGLAGSAVISAENLITEAEDALEQKPRRRRVARETDQDVNGSGRR